jgi:hypothetical protein
MEKGHSIFINILFTLSEMICIEDQTYLTNVYSKSCKEKKNLNFIRIDYSTLPTFEFEKFRKIPTTVTMSLLIS